MSMKVEGFKDTLPVKKYTYEEALKCPAGTTFITKPADNYFFIAGNNGLIMVDISDEKLYVAKGWETISFIKIDHPITITLKLNQENK